jgi:large subunit ribosomal protein L31
VPCLAHWTHIWFRFTAAAFRAATDPATLIQGAPVRPEIHPEYVETQATCTCGATFTTRSTAKNGVIHAEVCSQCHPFYTGKQKILDTGGRVARFEKRFGAKTKNAAADEPADTASK